MKWWCAPKPLALSAIIALSLCTTPSMARAKENWLTELESRIETMMSDWHIPACSVGIIEDNTVTFSRGFGSTEAGRVQAVNGKTIFAIASVTKAFTATALAILVDENKLHWDDPVTSYLPWFRLHAPYVTSDLRIRDLLIHNSGLRSADAVWHGTENSRREVVVRMRYQLPAHSFRKEFEYNNAMYIAAGLVVEAVSGQTWDAFVSDRILKPLGMVATNTSVRHLNGKANVATPHFMVEDQVRPVPRRNIDNVGPAGSINSNAEDMLKWLQLQLRMGEVDGQQLVSRNSMREMQMPQIVIRKEGFLGRVFPTATFLNYGLGWFISDFRDSVLIAHGGECDGYTTFLAFLPEKNAGVFVLANMHGAVGYVTALTYEILDRLLDDNSGQDWHAAFLRQRARDIERRDLAIRQVVDARIPGTSPTLPLEAYAGTFEQSVYPGIVINKREANLELIFANAHKAQVEHWHFDTFRVRWDWKMPDIDTDYPHLLRFEIGKDGAVVALHIDIDGRPTSFRRDKSGQPLPVASD